MRYVPNRNPRPRRQLSENQLALEVERRGAVCPLSFDEISEWARKLGGVGADREQRLHNLITYWFDQAKSASRVWRAADQTQERYSVELRLDQADSPDTMSLPPRVRRIDKRLRDLSNRLSAISAELLTLPDDVDAALHIRFAEYDEALDHFAALPIVLNTIAEIWHRRRPGQPSLEIESGAVRLLTCAIEDFTGKEFPSPRSYKRLAEIELVHLLATRLFPSSTPAQVDTMLRHFHKRRLDKAKADYRPSRGRQL